MKINAYASNLGWLFEDIKYHFNSLGIFISDKPCANYDGYICIRTDEIGYTPDLARTIVQVHDLYDHDVDILSRAALVIFTHPIQSWMMKRKGFSGRSLVLPIGSRLNIIAPTSMPRRPTIGFFCRETPLMEKKSDLFHEVVTTVRKATDVDVLMIGDNLEHIQHLGVYLRRAATPDDYQNIDLLFASSVSPAIPLSVYEACSVGIPIVTTPRWFPGTGWTNISFGSDIYSLSRCVLNVITHRKDFFEKREKNSYAPYLLEDWIRHQYNFFVKTL